MKSSGRLLVLFALVITGCAAYDPGPLSTSHPAHPEAAAAPVRPLSKTLAYTRDHIPSPQPLAAAQPGEPKAQDADGGAQQTVVGEGKVIATVPDAGQIVVEHGEIKGFMEGMTMGYRIDPPSLMEGLKSGDRVRFTIDVQKMKIIKIEKMK